MRNFLNEKGDVDEKLMDKLIILADEVVEMIVRENLSYVQAMAVLAEAQVLIGKCEITR